MAVHCKSLAWFGIIPMILVPVGVLVCYGIAVKLDHVPSVPEWPEVSFVGAKPPESCIFTFCFVWAAFFIIVAGFLYYRYAQQHGRKSKCNLAAFVMGSISSLGLTIVGAFQWENVKAMHDVGAILTFSGAIIYGWMIVHITRINMTSEVHLKVIFYLRVALSILQTAFGIMFVASLVLKAKDKPKYKTFAAVTEWALTYTTSALIGSLLYELGAIRSAQVNINLYSNANRYEVWRV